MHRSLRKAYQYFLCLFLMWVTNGLYAAGTKELFDAAIDTYIYGYPAVLSELTKQVMTNVPSAGPDARAPINQFSHADRLAGPDDKDIVRPNCDTLYSIAWLDLSKEPMVLSVPDTQERYYLMPFLDIWTEVFESIGKRTTGTVPKNFVVVGPHWQGLLPKNMPVVKALTNTMWIAGRTLVSGPEDVQRARVILLQYKLTPLSRWGTDYVPPTNLPTDPTIDMVTTPLHQVNQLDVITYFTKLAEILKKNAPHVEDKAILAQLKIVGIIPGEDFDSARFSRAEIKELDRAKMHALRTIEIRVLKLGGSGIAGWHSADVLGHYGTEYLDRAAAAFIGIGANIPEDSMYPTAFDDQHDKLLVGVNRYMLHFAADKLPPVNGFWSVTLYGRDNYLVENALHRYTLGDRSPMQFNKDGSLDIYIQNDSPGKNKESNWLPAPRSDFNLTLRLYWPKPEALSGEWQPEGLKKQ